MGEIESDDCRLYVLTEPLLISQIFYNQKIIFWLFLDVDEYAE